MTPASDLPAVTPAAFRALLGRFASGVTVVTAFDEEGRPHGMTVSAFASVSMSPPLVLVCIDRSATMLPMLQPGGTFAVNILAESQAAISQRFADEAMELRFDGIAWHEAEGRAPWIEGAHARLSCATSQRVSAGDHEILIGRVLAGDHAEDTSPLVYHRGAYGSLR